MSQINKVTIMEALPISRTATRASSSAPQTPPMFQTASVELSLIWNLECPFAWDAEGYSTLRQIQFVPSGSELPISFTATRNSKIWGYLPIIGTVIGVYRIYKAWLEFRLFDNTHLHHLSHRSIKWMIRGAIELFPIIGGIVCIIADIIATCLLSRLPYPSILPDSTPCGYCHTCPGYCKC